jgi:DNA topoisomerase-2
MNKIDININDYDWNSIQSINEKNDIKNFYDIEIEDDNTFFICYKDNMLLSHNCDGNHIKGLILNFLDVYFPELIQPDMNFLYEFITPIVKATYNKDVKYFYKLDDYRNWKKQPNSKHYTIKYFKGLGTLEPKEAKMFFKDVDKHLIKFNNDNIQETRNIIDLLFRQKRSNDRKDWLLNYEPNQIIDKFVEKTTIESFFNKEFIEFSMYDNIRSIPNLIDGFKPSQRKILYTCLKNNIKNDIKVSQLTGSVMKDSAYHHGNISLEGTIVNMAQDFVGSNNINLLQPMGQFGTRLKGGSDAASSRYIFTKLSDISRNIFNENDEPLLTYLDDDGFSIEPMYYVPIIPMVLVNGSSGIGTGWSTDIPNYNPNDIIKYLVNKIKNQKVPQLHPY